MKSSSTDLRPQGDELCDAGLAQPRSRQASDSATAQITLSILGQRRHLQVRSAHKIFLALPRRRISLPSTFSVR